ncbi:MAG: hypothetical protein LQ346_002905 [Caloplaca aetnensis]|nr:MAG: hypothetical protein LQ346_002905 [Caloplaca aetnensis]
MDSKNDEGSVRSNDDATSSLGDSAYDFVDDVSVVTTDDEDLSRMADSVSIAGKSTPEELDDQDLERTLSTINIKHRSFHGSVQCGGQSIVSSSASASDGASPGSSSRTPREQHFHQQLPADMRSIAFKEIRHGEGICQLDSPFVPKHLAVSLRQHMSAQELDVEGPYKLLYIGDVEGRERIINKIGAALASSTKMVSGGPLRYSVIPMPSSDDPDCLSDPILLDWSGYGMAVYHCVDAFFRRTDNGHDTIDLTMEGGAHIKSSWNGANFSVTGDWETPHIAIFYLSDTDDVSAKQTRRFARSFMARHSIPSIVISENPSWHRPSETMTLDHYSPHVCLQTKDEGASSSKIVKRLPIDLLTFLRLDPRQLNGNLAYLHAAYGAPISTVEKAKRPGARKPNSYRSRWPRGDIDGYLDLAMTKIPYLCGFLAAAGICLLLGFLIPQAFNFSPSSLASGTSPPASSNYAVVSSSIATSTASPQGKLTTFPSSTLPQLTEAKKLESFANGKSHTDLATLLESSPTTGNESEKFRVHVLGSTHLILKPPQWFTSMRKTPKLRFNVTQGDRVLKHDVSALFDGVYALELPKDDARGLVNISVWSISRPKFHESLQADFGNSWLRAAGWKKAASALSTSFRRDLDLVQTSIKAAYLQSSVELYSLMQKTLLKAQSLGNRSQPHAHASIGRLVKTQDLVLALPHEIASKLIQYLERKRIPAAKEISLHMARLRQGFSSHLFQKVYAAQLYARATPAMYQIHLRNTQKRALKMWWSVAGLPMDRPVGVVAQGKSRNFGGKRTSQSGNN